MSSRGQKSQGITQDMDLRYAIGLGKVTGVSMFAARAIGTEISTTEFGVLSSLPLYTECVFPPITGEELTIASDNPADVGIAIFIETLDAELKALSQVVVLNGTTLVPVPGSNGSLISTRVNSLFTLGPAAVIGIVTVQGPAGVVQGQGGVYNGLLPIHQRSLLGVFSCPIDCNFEGASLQANMIKPGGNADSAVEGIIYGHFMNSDVYTAEFIYTLNRRGSSSIQVENTIPPAVPGPFDLCFTGKASETGLDLFNFVSMILEKKDLG